MENLKQDEALTYEELTRLCRRLENENNDLTQLTNHQNEEIEKLEAKIEELSFGTLADNTDEKESESYPNYEELNNLYHRDLEEIDKLNNQVKALTYSLGKLYQVKETLENDVFYWKENYNREFNRAEKLFKENERLLKNE